MDVYTHMYTRICVALLPAPEDGHEGVEERAVRGGHVGVQDGVVHGPHCGGVCILLCMLGSVCGAIVYYVCEMRGKKHHAYTRILYNIYVGRYKP